MLFNAQCIKLHHFGGLLVSENIRTTVPVKPEVHAAFKRLADVQGVSLGRAIGDWLSDTFEAAEMVTAKMQKAKSDPVRVIRELQLLAEGSIDTASGLIDSLRLMEKQLPDPLYPPLCNTGGKVPKNPQKSPPRSRKTKP